MMLGAKISPDDELEEKFLPTYRSVPQTDQEIEAELMKVKAFLRRPQGEE